VTVHSSAGTAFVHVFADISGIPEAQLRDPSLLSGLLIAAASGAGLTAVGVPTVRQLPSGAIGGVLLLEGCHIAAHTSPARGLLLVDVLTPQSLDARKAVDVFARRFATAKVRIEHLPRG
jgi:S-adenosylmethionine/arginine decarboxylase-like enzyme